MACTCDEVGDYSKCWTHGDGTPYAVGATAATEFAHTVQIAMTTQNRREKLERCFSLLKINEVALTEFQEGQIRKAMEVR